MDKNYWFNKTKVPKILWNHLKNFFNDQKIAIDLGCAGGRLAKSLEPHFKHCFAVDKSEDLIKKANLNNSKIFYFNGDFGVDKTWRIMNQSFDLITSDCAIRKDYVLIDKLISICNNYLKDNGHIVFRLQSNNDLRNILQKEIRNKFFYSKNEIISAFNEFKIEFFCENYLQRFSSKEYLESYFKLIDIKENFEFLNQKIYREYFLVSAKKK